MRDYRTPLTISVPIRLLEQVEKQCRPGETIGRAASRLFATYMEALSPTKSANFADSEKPAEQRALSILREHRRAYPALWANSLDMPLEHKNVLGIMIEHRNEVWVVQRHVMPLLRRQGIQPRDVWSALCEQGILLRAEKQNYSAQRQVGSFRARVYVLRLDAVFPPPASATEAEAEAAKPAAVRPLAPNVDPLNLVKFPSLEPTPAPRPSRPLRPERERDIFDVLGLPASE